MSNSDHTNDFVNIVGPNRLQNELLVNYFTDKLPNVLCTSSSQPGINPTHQGKSLKKYLILLDNLGQRQEKSWPELDIKIAANKNAYFVLFNLPVDNTDEDSFLVRGFKGIFYENTPVDILCKGIALILKGELWYSRETVSRFLTERQSMLNQHETEPAWSLLTVREKEILARLASGSSNKDIADFLCISTHTVKTHLYNLYKKINVPNRFQAALWVAKHM